MKLKESRIVDEAVALLRQTLEKVPGVEMDAGLGVRLGSKDWRLVLEVKGTGQPQFLRQAAEQLKKLLRDPKRDYGVLVAPYISADGAQFCQAQGLGYLDLSGNCRLAFGPVYIERQGQPNRFSEKRQLKGLFSPKASLVLRTLLDSELGQPWQSRTWKIKDLAQASGASLGQAFAVARLLEAQDWAEGRRGRFQLQRPRRLLQAWAESYQAPVARSFSFYTSKDLDYFEKQSGIVAEMLYKDRFAQASFSAAARYAPNVRRNRSTLYLLGKIDAFVSRMQAEETTLKAVDSGPNVLILEPIDERVFVRMQRPRDIAATSPVQTYLDLMQESLRGPEAAEVLLSKVFGAALG
jgi:hypothetical protein